MVPRQNCCLALTGEILFFYSRHFSWRVANLEVSLWQIPPPPSAEAPVLRVISVFPLLGIGHISLLSSLNIRQACYSHDFVLVLTPLLAGTPRTRFCPSIVWCARVWRSVTLVRISCMLWMHMSWRLACFVPGCRRVLLESGPDLDAVRCICSALQALHCKRYLLRRRACFEPCLTLVHPSPRPQGLVACQRVSSSMA